MSQNSACISIVNRKGDYWVIHCGEVIHKVKKSELSKALSDAQDGLWSFIEEKGRELGSRLFNMVNGNGLIDSIRQSQWDKDSPSTVFLNIPHELSLLPFEVMWADGNFLVQREFGYLVRQVNDRGNSKISDPEDRFMKMLFMACSPRDSYPVLNFEEEEQAILEQFEEGPLPITLHVEESGSLKGLKNALYEIQGADIVHLSGHAKLSEHGPIFEMESETGFLDTVTPLQLWEAIRNVKPKILFLSGCETGKSTQGWIESYAQTMVNLGIPKVIAWGLSVGDKGATQFTRVFYKFLGETGELDIAINQARQAIRNDFKTWVRLRVFSDGSAMTPITKPARRVQYRTQRKERLLYLAEGGIKVRAYGFVGRRRELQLGTSVIRGTLPQKNGLLITGPAGIGKTSFVGKLLDRFPDKNLVRINGRVSQAHVVTELRDLFGRLGENAALDILNMKLPFRDRVQALFRGPLQNIPVLFFFDNFEDNLRKETDTFIIETFAEHTLLPFLEVLSWARGVSQLIVGSRHPFLLIKGERDLVDYSLCRITLMGLREADLRKKLRTLEYFSQKPFRSSLYLISGGNPRLLERFEAIASSKEYLEVEDLERLLFNEAEAYIKDFFIEALEAFQNESFRIFLQKACVFFNPVPAEAFKKFGPPEWLEKAVGLTLMEKQGEKEAVFWVTSFLREEFVPSISEEKELHQIAFEWYLTSTKSKKDYTLNDLIGLVNHGAIAFEMNNCWEYAYRLLKIYTDNNLEEEGFEEFLPFIDYIDEELISSELSMGNEYPYKFAQEFSEIMSLTGRTNESLQVLKSLEKICTNNYGRMHIKTSNILTKIAFRYKEIGNLEKAEFFIKDALEIRQTILDKDNPLIADTLCEYAIILHFSGNNELSLDNLKKALRIHIKVHGKKHINTIITLANYSSLLSARGEFRKSLVIDDKVLSIVTNIKGRRHPSTIHAMQNYGFSLMFAGKTSEAEAVFEEALEITRSLFPENSYFLVTLFTNLGFISGNNKLYEKGAEYLNKALEIVSYHYGNQHPDYAHIMGNLGNLFVAQEIFHEACKYFDTAYTICKDTFGENHERTAIRKLDIGYAKYYLGDTFTGKAYAFEALQTLNTTIGQHHPLTAAAAWVNFKFALEQSNQTEAREFYNTFSWVIQLSDKNLSPGLKKIKEDFFKLKEEYGFNPNI